MATQLEWYAKTSMLKTLAAKYQSTVSNDFPAIMGVTFVIALMYIVVNLAVDLTYALLDPQIRYA